MQPRTVTHPQLGPGKLLRTYMGGYEWEVEFASGRRFRLSAREFLPDSDAEGSPYAPSIPNPTTLQPREAVLEPDQYRARQTLEALRLGIVPVQDVETLTIGLEAERVSLDRALVRSRERGGDAIAVIGDYGFGKSHFIELAARRALREDMVAAIASLDLVETPPSKPFEIYRALVHSLRYPDTDETGLRPLINKALAHPGAVADYIARSSREKPCPFVAALEALSDCQNQSSFDAIVDWISGDGKVNVDVRSCLKRPPTLYRLGEVARQYSYMLTAISALATAAGYGGMAVLIDESEHYSLLRVNQRDRADAFFKAVIYAALGPANTKVDPKTIPDHPRIDYDITFASSPNLFFLFALTDSENRMPVDTWLAPSQIIRLDDRFIERDIRAFYETLLRYHAIAYAYEPSATAERWGTIVQVVPGLLSQALSQHRVNLREIIRVAVITCDLQYLHPEYAPETLLGELRRGLML
jgi:hypothetical protein